MEHTTYRSKKGVCTMAVDFSKSKTREKLIRAFAGENHVPRMKSALTVRVLNVSDDRY